ncbi:NIPSNAP family protein [Alkalihalobacillus pseudalcaliphilus]|uniref:NIPSNAP family protein n=1 Tax=Alkalihalobacillus pseudalcaliphilus TaxID=79884 RepID=UPI00064DFC72|nr:NIPSNAP family protein [Alkalihalobacillus pseudalcaliphilus]KMK77577.1 cytoplasmic protein [Alkalihalobacillus pseudalcaliphilus]
MFYRRKYYVVKNNYVDVLNLHFEETNLPNQLKHGAKLVGRWMLPYDEDTTEIFAIWEYDSYEQYQKIEQNIRADRLHNDKVKNWYESYGGREHVMKEYIPTSRNEMIETTLSSNKKHTS